MVGVIALAKRSGQPPRTNDRVEARTGGEGSPDASDASAAGKFETGAPNW